MTCDGDPVNSRSVPLERWSDVPTPYPPHQICMNIKEKDLQNLHFVSA